MVEEGRRSPGTAETYRRQLRKLSRPGARSGPAGRGTTPLVDKVICAMGRTWARDGQELSQRHLRTDQPELPDLVFFMLRPGRGPGSRAGRLARVDFDAGAVRITSTLITVRGEGLLPMRTKSRAGERTLPLPVSVVALLQRPSCTRPRYRLAWLRINGVTAGR